jgi:hypothetical protein
MSESAAVDAYKRMLEGVAERADRIGPRVIASHWPFVGTDYRRLLIVGQALAGWDDKTSPALWTPADVATLAGRDSVLAATEKWAVARPEPISEPLRTRAHSPFWSLSKRTVEALEPDGRGPGTAAKPGGTCSRLGGATRTRALTRASGWPRSTTSRPSSGRSLMPSTRTASSSWRARAIGTRWRAPWDSPTYRVWSGL